MVAVEDGSTVRRDMYILWVITAAFYLGAVFAFFHYRDVAIDCDRASDSCEARELGVFRGKVTRFRPSQVRAYVSPQYSWWRPTKRLEDCLGFRSPVKLPLFCPIHSGEIVDEFNAFKDNPAESQFHTVFRGNGTAIAVVLSLVGLMPLSQAWLLRRRLIRREED